MNMQIDMYTDGACSGNPGPGGFGLVVVNPVNDKVATMSNYYTDTTNNRMEMLGAISALAYAVKHPGHTYTIYTDSQYVYKGITEWLQGWKKRGWRKSNGEAVLNVDLWTQLEALNNLIHPTWNWVKGHASNKYNNMADQLATSAVSNGRGEISLVNIF